MSNNRIPINRINKFFSQEEITNSKFKLYGLYCPLYGDLKYVGITTQKLLYRLNAHLRAPTNFFIGKWFNSLKNKNLKPIIKIIMICETYQELLREEINKISYERGLGTKLFNISDGGDINPMYGKTHTKEARQKISKTHKGRKLSKEQIIKKKEILKVLWSNDEWANKTRAKMSERMLNNKYALGLKHSEETKKKLSKIHKGNQYCLGFKHSEETKKKMSENNKGKNNPMWGKSLPKKTLENRSKKVKEEGTFSGENNPNFKFKIHKNDLYRLYIINDMKIKDIANIYGCCKDVIGYNIKKYNIKKPKSNKYNLNIDKINEMLSKGLTQVKIGEYFGCSNKIINKFIKKHKNGK